MLSSIIYSRGDLKIVDQLKLPADLEYESILDTEQGWNAIKDMKVRGAPAIALVGVLSLAVELENNNDLKESKQLAAFIVAKLKYLVSARPTAVNMKEAADRFEKKVSELLVQNASVQTMKEDIIKEAELMISQDVAINKDLAKYGAEHILNNAMSHKTSDKCIILTHCNTGSLATAGYGTALGVIRTLSSLDKIDMVYFTETRPYNQGSRLTSFELIYEKIPSTMICDNMVAALMKTKKVSAVVVGADRVAANGDTANKIGTYQIALLAKHFDVPFYVACPLTTLDLELESGDKIVIEERPFNEMLKIKGIPLAPEVTNCWNPSFDVTPNELITGGIITEIGVFAPSNLKNLK